MYTHVNTKVEALLNVRCMNLHERVRTHKHDLFSKTSYSVNSLQRH